MDEVREKWAEHVHIHSDKKWFRQKGAIISALKSVSMTKEEFLKLKGENRK